MSTAMTPAKEGKVALRQAFENQIEVFKTLAGGDENVMRLLFLFQASIAKLPGLAQCNQNSILVGLMKCAELRLDPNTMNQAWMLPFGGEALWMPGYKGLEHLAHKTQNVHMIRAALVYESEMNEFDMDEGSKPFIRHKPNFRAQSDNDKGAIVLGYATAHFKNNETQFIWMPYEGEKESIMARARRSKTHKVDSTGKSSWAGPWKTDPVAMMLKTLSLTLCKRRLDTNARDPLGRAVAYDDEEGDGRKPGDFDSRYVMEEKKPSKAETAISMYEKPETKATSGDTVIPPKEQVKNTEDATTLQDQGKEVTGDMADVITLKVGEAFKANKNASLRKILEKYGLVFEKVRGGEPIVVAPERQSAMLDELESLLEK